MFLDAFLSVLGGGDRSLRYKPGHLDWDCERHVAGARAEWPRFRQALEELVRERGPAALMKLDCEGCEARGRVVV